MHQIEGVAEYPLYQVTKTDSGVVLAEWLDGNYLEIGLFAGGGTRGSVFYSTTIVNVETWEAWQLGDTSWLGASRIAHHADGTHLAYVIDDEVWVADRDGGNRHRLTAGTCNYQGHCYSHPVFSPDGHHLAYHFGLSTTQVIDVELGKEIYTCSVEALWESPVWSTNGRYLAFFTDIVAGDTDTGTVRAVVVDLNSGQENSSPALSTLALGYGAQFVLHWLDDNRLLIGTTCLGLWVADGDMSQIELLPGGDNLCYGGISPDKNWVVYARLHREELYSPASYLYNIASGEAVTLSRYFNQETHWSPNSERVLLIEEGEREQGRLVNVITGEQSEVLLPGLRDREALSWSTDSRWIAYIGDGLWLVDPSTGHRMKIAPEAGCSCCDVAPRWSPDGRSIVFMVPTRYYKNCDIGELHLVDLSNLSP
jgi:Tol biopolymer transport system component